MVREQGNIIEVKSEKPLVENYLVLGRRRRRMPGHDFRPSAEALLKVPSSAEVCYVTKQKASLVLVPQ